MQKALLTALLLCGAFFSNYSFADPAGFPDNSHLCEASETFISGFGPDGMGACAIVAPEQSCKITRLNGTNHGNSVIYTGDTIQGYTSALTATNTQQVTGNSSCPGLITTVFTHDFDYSCSSAPRGETRVMVPYTTTMTKTGDNPDTYNNQCTPRPINITNTLPQSMAVDIEWSDVVECPAENPIGPVRLAPPNDLNQYCYRLLVDEEPPCDDPLGNCEEPPTPPDCFIAGNGMEICKADPNEKCDVESVNGEPVYTNCESGCGFRNDEFLCTTEPDLPSLDDCIVTANGYACPSDIPPPDDDIQDPNKPLPDMAKGDFKDVLKGVETRMDGTNKLLSEQIKRDQENANKLAGLLQEGNKALGKANASLDAIDSNTKRTADALYSDDEPRLDSSGDRQQLLDGLGITGDEKFEDLEKSEISLDSYRNQFSWSVGSAACPAPTPITMLNRSFSIEWQPYCDAFGVIGYFVKAAALLISGFIAFGVRK